MCQVLFWVYSVNKTKFLTLRRSKSINVYILCQTVLSAMKKNGGNQTVMEVILQMLFLLFIVTKSCPTLQSQGLQHTRLLCPNSCPLSWWCYLTISSSVAPFSFCPQSFQALGSFPMSQLLASGGQSIGASASASVLPMNNQGWICLGLTGWISLQSKGLSRVFSSVTIQKHQFFGTQPSLWSNSHMRTWLLEKIIALTICTFVGKVMSLFLI